ncbi:tRNA1(Val) (adenine(37)-N6)-methyltransferase [Oceanisphaera sp. W20_SRM_FM3]|uniref:tRNA1(Val) (adenine(37)-N6)-methyltransferase n=1 Tax=Oceanisphaera sp. W20_SRM_FM3 TaxID=3240267 RepID=UPI003F98CE87
MSSRGFTFKQFHINHDRCGMKVGTDGILLGAWAPLGKARRILDLGTGSGLVALMLAQRVQAERIVADVEIVGLELDAAAVRQAAENVAASPWPSKVLIEQGAIQDYQAAGFDLIVSNPPYFEAGQVFDCAARGQARHTASLSVAELFMHAKRLLEPEGRVALVLPLQALAMALKEAELNDLHLVERQDVYTKEGKEAQRFLLLFSSVKCCEINEKLIINTVNLGLSDTYVDLVRPFYLKM